VGWGSLDHHTAHTSAELEETLMASSTQLPRAKPRRSRKKGPTPTVKVLD